VNRFAIIGFGSSLRDGDRVIARARHDIDSMTCTRVVSMSDVIRTAAFGGQTLTPFWNAACVVETTLTPLALMSALHAVERAHGRVRVLRNAARALDLDLLLFEHCLSMTTTRPAVVVPHPGLGSRASALFPAREAWRRAERHTQPHALRARLSARGLMTSSGSFVRVDQRTA